MFTRQIFCAILSLSVVLGLCHVAIAKSVSTDAEVPSQQAQEEDDLKELNNQIRREKFDIVLPQVMKKNNTDLLLNVRISGLPAASIETVEDNKEIVSGIEVYNERIW